MLLLGVVSFLSKIEDPKNAEMKVPVPLVRKHTIRLVSKRRWDAKAATAPSIVPDGGREGYSSH